MNIDYDMKEEEERGKSNTFSHPTRLVQMDQNGISPGQHTFELCLQLSLMQFDAVAFSSCF